MLVIQVSINLKTGESKTELVETARQPPRYDPFEILAERMVDSWLKEKSR